MAVVSHLGTATFNTTSGTKTVTATPAVGDLIVIVAAHTGNTSAAAPTDDNSGGAGTYVAVESAVKATSADTMKVWIRNALIGSASSTVFTHAPGASSGGGIVVFKVTVMSIVGAAAERGAGKQDNAAAAGTPAPVLLGRVTGTSQAALTENPMIGAVFNATNPAALTPRASWTEAPTPDVGYATPTAGLETAFRSSGETASTITWGGTSASAFCSIAVELDTSDPIIDSVVASQLGQRMNVLQAAGRAANW